MIIADALGQPVLHGDYFVYGVREGNSGAVRYGKVLEIEEKSKKATFSGAIHPTALIRCLLIRPGWNGVVGEPYKQTLRGVCRSDETIIRMRQMVVMLAPLDIELNL